MKKKKKGIVDFIRPWWNVRIVYIFFFLFPAFLFSFFFVFLSFFFWFHFQANRELIGFSALGLEYSPRSISFFHLKPPRVFNHAPGGWFQHRDGAVAIAIAIAVAVSVFVTVFVSVAVGP